MKKAYFLLFYKLSHFFKFVSEDNWEKGKAFIVVNILCGYLLIELIVWWTVLTKYGVHFSKYWISIPVFITIILNYNFLMSSDNWNNYKKEFKSYSRRKNKIINLFLLILIVLVLGSLVLAFYYNTPQF